MLAQDVLQRRNVVPGSKDYIVERCGRNAFGVRNPRGMIRRAQLVGRMAVAVQEIRIVPAVVVAFKLEELGAPGVRASQPQRQHGGFAAGIGETHDLRRGHHAAETLCRFHLCGRSGGEMRSFGDGLRDDFDNFRMSVTLDESAERHHEVDVLVAVGVPHVRAMPAFENDRAILVDGRATRRRVNALYQ